MAAMLLLKSALLAVTMIFAPATITPAAASTMTLADTTTDAMPADPAPPSDSELSAFNEKLSALPTLAAAGPADQHRRALVIGNDAYIDLTPLNKAVGDSDTIAGTLRDLGFEVTRLDNLAIDPFDEALDGFYASLRPGDVAFVFYSGHGLAYDGINYLLPTDMPKLEQVKASRLERYAVDAAKLVDEVKARGVSLAFIVLDACRNNPFPAASDRGAAALAGLARMTPEEGAFVIYSAGIGQTALDRLGAADPDPNSVFTRKFWQILKTPGLPVVDIAKRTQIEVAALAATVDHEQAPAYYDQIIGQFYFQPPKPKLYGIVIGINNYGGRLDLKGPVNDANRIGDALEAAGAERVVRILDRDARVRFVDYVWHDLLDRAHPGDTIALTFSGHASQEPQPAGQHEADGMSEFLLLVGDGDPAKVWNGKEIDPAWKLSDIRLTQWMAEAADKNVNVLLFVDGGHGGGMLNRTFANVSFIGSTQESGQAVELPFGDKRYGMASFAFANAISGGADFNRDGFITQRELFGYLEENVYRMSAHRQRPHLFPEAADSGSGLALLRVPASAAGAAIDLKPFWRDRSGKARPAQ